ncbi:hypothetical protein A8L34_01300 [Bacillus sp. FJAT-27264]|uniref:hypothetical protein n=1 Tax=Paenibacillus sp. (strain DSM 101736 / FJAT-27264) TaxID=1850362 RepID=UPI00080814BA|nr:hypothetical protein [Bacillus sp. FJAT-27264]OBZ18253.1 hypothetical protein A8L34_01300 [Bacillus sp. FJAT-27264]
MANECNQNATGQYSTVEGIDSIASGIAAHVEGSLRPMRKGWTPSPAEMRGRTLRGKAPFPVEYHLTPKASIPMPASLLLTLKVRIHWPPVHFRLPKVWVT